MLDSLCVVLPVHNADRLSSIVAAWQTALARIDRPAELLVVDDGSSLPVELPNVRVVRHDARRGVGACLRSALAVTNQPLVVTCSLDYPYIPSDLATLLKEAETEHDVIAGKLRPALVSGCRGGRPAPPFWKTIGATYRLLARVCCGFRPEKPQGWLGVRGHWHSWAGWLLFANPLIDPDSAFKLYRRELFDLFPIQSDGDFVHTELVAKATFCTRLVAEIPLTPNTAHAPVCNWVGWWTIFARPMFTPVPPPIPSPLPADG